MWIIIYSLLLFPSLFWLLVALRTLVSRDLPKEIEREESESNSLLSVVVVFCNEEKALPETLQRLADQTYPHLEFVLVDDRSTDRSAEIAEGFVRLDKRFRLIPIETLPSDWLGKPHALHRGVCASHGEYVLCMDADSLMARSLLSSAIHKMEREKLDHLSIAPRPVCHSWLERAAYAGMWILLALYIQVWSVNKKASSVGAGVGAFNLFRRSALEAVRGFESLKFEIVDDMGIVERLRKHGFKSLFSFAGDRLQIRFQEGLWGLVTGVEKNAFAATRFSWWWASASAFFLLFVSWAPIMCLFSEVLPVQLMGIVGLASFLLFAYRIRYFSFWFLAISLPLVCLMMSFATLRSAALITYRGGVMWRDTFYSLRDLKAARRKL